MSNRGHRSNDVALRMVHKLLESHFWLPTLTINARYERNHDTREGNDGNVMVMITPRTEVWVRTWSDLPGGLVNFRPKAEDGHSPRVRSALLVLAEAIRLDNEDEAKRKGQSHADS